MGRAICMRDLLASPVAFKAYLSEHCNTTAVSFTAPAVNAFAKELNVRSPDLQYF